jgi:hypothetical protein
VNNPDRPDFSREEAYYRPRPYAFERELSERRRPIWRRHLAGIIASLSLTIIIVFAWTTFALLVRLPFVPSLQVFTIPKPKSASSVSTPGVASGTSSNPISGPVHTGLPCTINISTWTEGSPDWVVQNSILYNDGSNEKSIGPTIIAPCQPGTPNYAVEAKIQLINQVSGCFGIVLRTSYATSICNSQYQGSPDTAYIYHDSNPLTSNPFSPGTTLHTYRAEVQNNTIKFFIDDSLITTATDNRLLTSETSEQVGLYCQSLQLQVTSFQVTALP